MNKKSNADKNSLFLKIGIALILYTALIVFFCIFSRSFAEMYSKNISSMFRSFIAYITGIFPFSVAEFLVLVLPLIVIIVLIMALCKKINFKTLLYRLLFCVSLLFFLFFNVFGVCYFRNPIEKNIGIDDRVVSDKHIVESAAFIKTELERVSKNIEYKENGSSINSKTAESTDEALNRGFGRLSAEYDFIDKINVRTKPVLLSPLMTYTHISGMFFPFTAEANVNTNYPEYVVAFSAAHEMAHQRGVAGEDEANFVAFLACLASDDDYLEYCALLSMYEYYIDEIYKIDSELYFNLMFSTDKRILGELKAYSEFFDKYRDSSVSSVADTVNDTYIKIMGDSDGVDSYGRVVELCTKYLIQKEALPY